MKIKALSYRIENGQKLVELDPAAVRHCADRELDAVEIVDDNGNYIQTLRLTPVSSLAGTLPNQR